METCACCQHPVEKLVLHHWFQPPEYKVQAAYVCDPCNRLLIPTRLWPRDSFITNDWDTDVQIELNHVLPQFFLQQLFALDGHYSDRYNHCLRRMHIFPLVAVSFPNRHIVWYRARYSVVPLRARDDAAQFIKSIRKLRKDEIKLGELK